MITDIINKLLPYINFFFNWGWTILFALILLKGYFKGRRKGLYKMAIRFKNYLICFAVAFIGFLITSKTKLFDSFMLYLYRTFADGLLENAFKFTSEAETLSEYITDLIYSDGIASFYGGKNTIIYVLLFGSKAYVLGLIQIVYNLVFVIFWYIIFFILRFISTIFILLFKSEKKKKKKQNKRFENKLEYYRYRKEPHKGGLIGLTKAFIKASITTCVIGSSLFTVVGRGKQYLADMDFGKDDINSYYQVLQCVESYGSYGIYKVLNGVTDKNNIPYYLYLTDIIFGCSVEEDGIKYKYNLVNETGSYMDFMMQMVNLAEQYFSDEIVGIVSGDLDKASAINKIVQLFQTTEFQNRIIEVIDGFNDETFAMKLSMCCVDVLVENIPKMDLGLNDNLKELVSICFDSSYLCYKIPDEAELLAMNKTATRPVLKASQLGTKTDIVVLLRSLIDLMGIYGTDFSSISIQNTDQLGLALDCISNAVNNLSLFKTNPENFNKFLTRIYCYAENSYLTEGRYDGIRYDEFSKENCNWLNEIKALISSNKSILTLYGLYQDKGLDYKELLHSIFDEEYEDYEKYNSAFNDICNVLKTTTVLDKVLSSKIMSKTINEALNTSLQQFGGFVLPDKVRYTNRLSNNGQIIEYGEICYLLNGLSLLASNSLDLIDQFLNPSTTSDTAAIPDMSKFTPYINTIEELMNSDKKMDGLTLKDCLVNSVYLRSGLSTILIGLSNNPESSIPLYISNKIKEIDSNGQYIDLIKKEEMDFLLSNVSSIISAIPTDSSSFDFNTILGNENIINLLTSQDPLLEGALGKLIINMAEDNEMIKIPKKLKDDLELWISSDTSIGESSKILNILNNETLRSEILKLFPTNTNTDDDTNDEEEVSVKLLDGASSFDLSAYQGLIDILNEETVSLLLESDVCHYTISNILCSGQISIPIILPDSSTTSLKDDCLDKVVKKSELEGLIALIKPFIADASDYNKLIPTLIRNKNVIANSNILCATIANMFASGQIDALSAKIPEQLDASHYGSEDNLKSFTNSNPWKQEIPRLLEGIEEVKYNEIHYYTCNTDITIDGKDYTADADAIKDTDYDILIDEQKECFSSLFDFANIANGLENLIFKLNDTSSINSNKQKVDIIYNSLIIKKIVTETMEQQLTSANIATDVIIASAKENGMFKVSEIKGFCNILTYCDIKTFSDINETSIKEKLGISGTTIDLSKFTQEIDDQDSSLNGMVPINIFGESTIVWTYFSDYISASITTLVTAGKIDGEVNEAIKVNGAYPNKEISNLLNALTEMGITDISSLASFDFMDTANKLLEYIDDENDNVTENERRGFPLSTIYSSDLIAAAITKYLDDNITGVYSDDEKFVIRNDNAYRSGIKIYKEGEINAMLKFAVIECGCKSMTEISVPDYNNIIPSQLANYIHNGQETVSWIMTSTLSKPMNNIDGITIPNSCKQSTDVNDKTIKPKDLRELLLGIGGLCNNSTIANLDLSAITNLSSGNARDAVLNSAILRYKLTQFMSNGTGNIAMKLEYQKGGYDIDSLNTYNEIILSKTELVNLMDFISTINGGLATSFGLASSSLESGNISTHLTDDTTRQYILNSSILRVAVSDTLLTELRTNCGNDMFYNAALTQFNIKLDQIQIFPITDFEELTLSNVLTNTGLTNICNAISNPFGGS